MILPQIVVYTCMVGRYDYLLPPKSTPPNIRYVAFLDRPVAFLRGWEQRSLADEAIALPDSLQNRYHKFFPHRLFPHSDWTVYIDSNIRILGDVTQLVEQTAQSGMDMACPPHPSGRTLEQEVEACIVQNKAPESNLRGQVQQYCRDGIAPSTRITENNVVVRKTDSEAVIRGMELWWTELTTKTARDQISLPYVIEESAIPFSFLSIHARQPNAWVLRYDHRKAGIRGLWQYVRLRRNDNVCWKLCYALGRFLIPGGRV